MSRFIYLQDFHISGVNSINYQGNYYQDCLEIFKEILQLAKANQCEMILDGGDLLNTELVSNTIIDDLLDLIEEYKIPYKALIGNHSMRFCNFEASKGTSFYHMVKRSKYFNYLTSMKCGQKYEILPIDYKFGIEDEIKEKGIFFKDTKRWKIAIVHMFVCPKIFPYASHIVADELKTNADIIFCAHNHSVWSKQVNNTKFEGIGCLGRRSINEANIKPSVVIIDTEKRDYEIIKLKSIKKGNEIFDLTKVQKEKEVSANLSNFLESLENFTFQNQDVRQKIKELAKANKTEKEVVDNILERLNKNAK